MLLKQKSWQTSELYIALQVTELKDICKQERMKGYSKLKKDQLINLLQEQMQSR